MSDAFKESNAIIYRQSVTFYTGFSIIADESFSIGSPSTTGSFLNTYNQVRPYGGISGYAASGQSVRIGSGVAPATTGAAGTQGDIAFDTGYLYLCVGNNNWRRTQLLNNW